jgi:ATP-dependent protease ClpP protease subunit
MKITPFLNVKKKDNVANIEIFGDIGYNSFADNSVDYLKNTSEVKAKEIKALQEIDVEVINLTMESLGGDVSHALAIYSLLKNSGATINTYYRGANASVLDGSFKSVIKSRGVEFNFKYRLAQTKPSFI